VIYFELKNTKLWLTQSKANKKTGH